MKLTWKNKNTSNSNHNNKKRSLAAISHFPNLPFEHQEYQDQANSNNEDGDKELALGAPQTPASLEPSASSDAKQLAESFQSQGNKLAEHGKYREALGKWEAALMLMPEIAVIHEQKAQVLLEIGDSWKALKAATRATELEPSWAEAWITLGRAQLNFGEPDSAIESFDRALAIKPDSKEAQDDKRTASHLIKRRKQLHSEGLNATENRYMVGDSLNATENRYMVGDSLNATENRYMVGDMIESSQGILIRKE